MIYFKKMKLLLLSVLFLVMLFISKPVVAQDNPVSSITIIELKEHMEFLASDDLDGRVSGSEGYKMAAKYSAEEFKKANLKTMFKDEEGNPSYFQPVPITPRSRRGDDETKPKEFISNNIIGFVEGTDPELKNEYVTVGAHLDHVKYGDKVYNGADDNASGSVGVIEIAEAIAMNPPKRSVIFLLFTGEEMGLIGSRYFLNNPPVPLDNIVANINLDMIGRTGRGLDQEKKEHILRYSSKVSPEFKKFVKKVNKKTINWPLVYKEDKDSPGGSDHMSFLRKDIPAIFFFSGLHSDLHRPGDDADKIEYEKMQKICQLVYELTMELGKLDKIF